MRGAPAAKGRGDPVVAALSGQRNQGRPFVRSVSLCCCTRSSLTGRWEDTLLPQSCVRRLPVHLHGDQFPQNAPHAAWLSSVGERG